MRAVHVHAPNEVTEKVWNILINEENCHGLYRVACDFGKSSVVCFKCGTKHTSQILKTIEGTGVGSTIGSLDIYSLQSSIPDFKDTSKSKSREYRYWDRQTVREIESKIDSGNHLTFDYIAMTVVAATISSVGLLTGSAVTVVASMLVSPLMGPLLSVAYGISVRSKVFMWKGFRNECWGVLLCALVGVLTGLVAAYIYHPNGLNLGLLESSEMKERGQSGALVSSISV